MGDIGLGWRIGNSHDRSDGSDIGHRRGPPVNPFDIDTVRASTGVPVMLAMAAIVMGPGAVPAISMPMGAVIRPIRVCLGAQRA